MFDSLHLAEQNILSDSKRSGDMPAHGVSIQRHQLRNDNLLEHKLANPGMKVTLTKREREILDYILAGKTNREIAQHMYRTERTIEYHRNRIMRKLGTRNTVELVKCAIALGIA